MSTGMPTPLRSDATLSVVVHSARHIAHGVRSIALVRRDGLALPTYSAGAHIDLHLAPGLVRQYSLCGPIGEAGTYTIAVKREPQSRGGSQAVHELLAPGTPLHISAPRNNFALNEDATDTTLVAGGIGITPLLCMARRLLSLNKPFRLHYFARSVEHAAFSDVLRSPAFEERCTLHLGLSHEETATALEGALATPGTGAQVYLCGPKAFMDTVRTTASRRGWPDDSIHLEYFNAGQDAPRPSGSSISVRLARSGITVPVAAGIPIIDAVRAAGVVVDTSCEQGVCGTCITGVLDGVPQHNDLFLTDAEKARGDCMAICVSRALTPSLVLDL